MLWKALVLASIILLLFIENLCWRPHGLIAVLHFLLFLFLLFSKKLKRLQKISLFIALFFLGLAYSQWRAESAMAGLVSAENHGTILEVDAQIVSSIKTTKAVNGVGKDYLRKNNTLKHQFDIVLRDIISLKETSCATERCRDDLRQGLKIRINYYEALNKSGTNESSSKGFGYGDLIHTRIKLREVEGTSSPGSFDIRKYALSKGIDAYASTSQIELIQTDSGSGLPGWLIDFRGHVLTSVAPALKALKNEGIFRAILFGDKQEINEDLNQKLIATGTRHLLAVSGLHISIVMGLFASVSALVTRYLPLAGQRRIVVACCAGIGGLVYLLVSAFPVSGLRAYIMACIVLVTFILGSQGNPVNCLLTAAVVLLVINPTAVLSNGFWLSFFAVGVLCWGLANVSPLVEKAEKSADTRLDDFGSTRTKLYVFLYRLFFCQWLLFIGMPVIYAILGIPASTTAVASNMILVPVFSLLIIPLCFFALILEIVGSMLPLSFDLFILDAPVYLFSIADKLTTYCLSYLSFLDALSSSININYGLTFWPLPVFFVGLLFIIIFLRGRHYPGFVLCVPAVMLCLFPGFNNGNPVPDRLQRQLNEQDVSLIQIDVGQGSAYLISSRRGHWLYDTGPEFHFGGDAGLYSVIPLLHYYGVRGLEAIIISHGDSDHRGGLSSILKHVPVKQVFQERSASLNIGHNNLSDCRQLMQTVTLNNQFYLRSIWPEPAMYKSEKTNPPGKLSNNDLSCVIQICHRESDKANSGRCPVLLTGDIGARAEKDIVHMFGAALHAPLMSIGHHGSLSSSAPVFLDAVSPDWGLISSGRHNRYGHPHARVLQRLELRKIQGLQSSELGTVQFIYRSNKKRWNGPFCSRFKQQHFWQTTSTEAIDSCVALTL